MSCRSSVTPNLRWHGDGTRIKQVIANLLSNAARYTPAGGHVNLSVGADGGELVIRVQDDGQGLDAELLPRLFEPFVQGPRDASRSDGGLGLGLAVVKGLVGLHGGSVSANSDGPGTRQRVRRTAAGPAHGRVITTPTTN